MSKHNIYTILILLSCLLLCQCSNNNQSKSNDRSDYVQRAREQDSLRIAHYQDSVEKARLAAIAQKEKEESKRLKVELERKKQEEAKSAEERRVAEERAKKEAEVKRIAEEKAKASGIIQGHEYVDLGLSVLWATCNIGASYPFERGDYFSWGEVETKSNFSRENYKYDKNDVRNIGKNISSSSYDAATKKWGKNWRTPTLVEMKELINNCLWEKTTLQGCKGYKITGKNGKFIFLPATGMDLGPGYGLTGADACEYWTATLSEEYDFNAYCLSWNKIDDPYRAYGLCIRPVSNISNAKQTVSYDDLVSDKAKNSAPTFGLG